MKKFLRITLSLVLAVILFATAMPIYAVEDTTVEEIEELREENVKHFKMNDGTYKAVVYSEPVHRRDADGNWQDIDNTLSADNESNYVTSDGRVKFSRNVKKSGGSLFELSENGYKISLSLIEENIKSASARIKNHGGKRTPTVFDSEKEKLEKLKEVDNLTRVRYNDITEDVDIEYEIYSNNIKESIIVNSKKDSYVYRFELKLNKMTAALNEDGEISLSDEKTGEVKYIMPAPFMFDDNGELSTDVYYTLTPSGKYKYELTVTASAEWINEKDRDFPVTIDPTTVSVTGLYGEAYVSSSNPNTNYRKANALLAGTTYRTFLWFDLPTVSPYDKITDAVLDIKYYFNSTGNVNIAAYAVPYSWSENTITWNNSVASHTSLESSVTPFASEYLSSSNGTESDPAFMYLDMTSVVRDWYAGKANNGIAIKGTSGSADCVVFKGYNTGIDTRARLEITYERLDNVLTGTFFFRNVQHNTYMQSGASNAIINAFDGDTNQKWNISYLHNGYYKITSTDGTVALTAPSTANNNITLSAYTASNNQMWNITQDLYGNYMISPKNNLTCYAVSGAIISSSVPNERYLVLNQSSSTTNGNKWILYQVSTDGVNSERQETGHWCWSACLRMFISAYIDPPPVSQKAIAVSGHLDIFVENPTQQQISIAGEQEGSNEMIVKVINFILGNTDIFRYERIVLTESDITTILNHGHPIIAEVGDGSHYVLIYGYRYDNSELIIKAYDPIKVSEEEHNYEQSYNEFKNGWLGSVTMNLDNIL